VQGAARVILYPEGATEATADYILTYTLPAFEDEAMNAALSLYEEELIARVTGERMPYADRAEGEIAPYTTVTSEVVTSGSYTNIVFTERFGYAQESEEVTCFALVLDGLGQEVSFYEASGLYAPEDLVAQQVWNLMDAEDPAHLGYYGDLSTEEIKLGLDLYNGFSVTDTGYTVYFQPGVLADAATGVLDFEFERSAVYPDFVGDALDQAKYEALAPALRALACACGVSFYNYSGEEMDAYTATTFMSRLYRDGWTYENGFAYVDKAEYEANFKAWLGIDLPGDLSAGNGTALDGDKYRIPDAMIAEYGLRLDDARVDSKTLTLNGVVYSGVPGTAEAAELWPVTVTLQEANTDAGYILAGFEMD
jgi:hypothetical protein